MINDLWYKNAIIYCVSVGSYMDAKGTASVTFRA
jgi:maltose alpha-D-glucosyltransferase / alpha-amylase